MHLRTALVGGLAVTALLTMNAEAAPAPLVEDAAGDANGANDQGTSDVTGVGFSAATAPASRGAADIVSLTYEAVKKKKVVTGYRITWKLSGKPDVGIVYRAKSSIGDCYLWPALYVHVDGTRVTQLVSGCADTVALPPAIETADGIVMEIPLKAHALLKKGAVLTGLGAETRFTPKGSPTAPVYDLAASDKTYKIGS